MASAAATPGIHKSQTGSLSRRLRSGDEIAWLITLLFATSVLVITALLMAELWIGSAASREKFGFDFLMSRMWNPVTEEFGAWPFLYGTVVTSGLALLISVP